MLVQLATGFSSYSIDIDDLDLLRDLAAQFIGQMKAVYPHR
jgi:hypothetical protein